MKKTSSSATTKISTFVLLVIFITLALSLTALILAINAWYTPGQEIIAGYLVIIGFLGVALSTYVLLQGDYVFKEVESCQKCNENMLITAIYREVKEKRVKTRF